MLKPAPLNISFLLFFWDSVACVFLPFSEYFQVILGFSIAIHNRLTIIS